MAKFLESRGSKIHLPKPSTRYKCMTMFIKKERKQGREEPVFTQPQVFRAQVQYEISVRDEVLTNTRIEVRNEDSV